MLHYKAVAKTPVEKIKDILLGVFGVAAMIFTTAQTIKESCLTRALRNDSDCIHSSWLSRSLHLYQPLERAEKNGIRIWDGKVRLSVGIS
jgi:hypothetical protein